MLLSEFETLAEAAVMMASPTTCQRTERIEGVRGILARELNALLASQ